MEKRTLLQKYEIPISHLDFEYIKKCNNVKELEKIVTILRSGEEGYYPDLTKCAEDKVRQLKPQSRALRTEERLITKHSLSLKDWQEHSGSISEWSTEIKNKDSILSKSSQNEIELPPIRKGGKVDAKKVKDNNLGDKSKQSALGKTTNYSQWDKYDADAEILKMDLEEERSKEQIERLNRINEKKSARVEFTDDDKSNKYQKLSVIEKEKLSEDYKTQGNEYFKLKEYTNALEQYSRCIEILPSVAGYNNRAITNLKLQRHEDALADCNECLKLDKSNLKALLRKAEAYMGMGWKHDAFRTYEQVRLIEPTNAIACKTLEGLRKELGEVAPIHATRLQIMECGSSNEKSIEKYKPSKAGVQQPKPPIDYNLAELIKPNKVVKNSLIKTMENLGKVTPDGGEKTKSLNERTEKAPQFQKSTPEIRLQIEKPHHARSREQGGRMLIQEL